ncbi:S8 family serine peptidase [Sulfuriferula sp.]|uniref:S8 family serine peptidase n=1 Tax=Sulfuriferula sp. TaxID=2025307 RepID=UPI00272F38C5|nr:S8 family serine peptidase [Sulfuriferula sp.]MDP2025827.1 S8 family serine peptidase [Sulfuriferula sp.]
MTTTFGAVPTVKANDGTIVSAKWLQDDAGNYILNPVTQMPYIVAASFDLGAFIDKYAAMGQFPGPAALLQTRLEIKANFARGKVDDHQRSYNGLVNASFVEAFRPAASFIYGVAAEAAGLANWEPVAYGGVYNWLSSIDNPKISTAGDLWNNPPNDTNIREGTRFFEYLAQGIRIGYPPVVVNSTTTAVANTYVNSAQSNLAAGKAPDGSPLGVSLGNAKGAGQVIWVKDQTTGKLTQVAYQVSLDGTATTWEVKYDASGVFTNATTYITDALGSTKTYSSGPVNAPNPASAQLTRDTNVASSSANYVIQKGDTLWDLAQSEGVTLKDYLDANPQITHPNLINEGQVINKPGSALSNPNNSLLNITTNTNPQPTLPDAIDETFGAGQINQGYLDFDATSSVWMPTNFVNGSGWANQTPGAISSDDYRPGEGSLLSDTLFDLLAPPTVQDFGYTNNSLWGAGWLNNTSQQSFLSTYVDPLVLDLNGDGVKLTDYTTNPVLFDIDNDGGTQEVAGWTSAQDGIVVMDLNNNGKIDNISETFSEYFNGTAGVGEAGTKPYVDGFAALKSLDSNADNLFNSSDTAFANVKVWVDANHDAVTDAGELKTLAALSITQINLNAQTQSGLVRDGNEVLATGSFVQAGLTKEAIAANFLANPNGHSFVTSGTGTIVSTQGGLSSYVATSPTGETIDVALKGVTNAYGATGNDTLIGDGNANWLAGGAGADSFNAGAGDDVLLIDANDLQANIHGGAGIDIAQVIGDGSVTLNLTQAEIEVAQGGRGNDVFISGGRSNTFVRGGEGDDILIGGAANDALSGEKGDDLIDGGAGNDLLRGHSGRDVIMGGAGDDIITGGLDDDQLEGGSGNDILSGNQGDDRIDGGDGVDIAEFTGSYADYRITRGTDGFWISDTKAGRDGTDYLTGIEKFNFANVKAVDVNLANPLPVKDVIAMASRSTAQLIAKAQLLGNDIDFQGDVLHLTGLYDVKGGVAAITTAGDVLFTPDATFKGVMSFKYTVADSANNPGGSVVDLSTGQNAEMRAAVYLQTSDMPGDPGFVAQWYITDANILPVWQDYTGKGVRIGQFEPGGEFAVGPEVFNYRDADLAPNVDRAWLAQSGLPTIFSQHATSVAGVMVAARNGEGAVGVAYDATVAGFYIPGSGVDLPSLVAEMRQATKRFQDYDVVNNSWGFVAGYIASPNPPGTIPFEVLDAISYGRNGLGTSIVFAGGNDRAAGDNTNHSLYTNSYATITVGAINAPGDLGALVFGEKPFSNPGASILVSAPGSNVSSTGQQAINQNGSTFGADLTSVQGSSFAAPIVSGIIALMLDANPNLGYRDIQEILSLSATQVSDPNGTDWVYNGAKDWNGGGRHISHDYGYGKVDALAAVRMAESWYDHSTYFNLAEKTATSGVLNAAIPDGSGSLTQSLALAAGLEVEHVDVLVDLGHAYEGDLIIKLKSPSGTESILFNRPGKAPGSAASERGDLYADGVFTFGSTRYRGEESGGAWTLEIIDAVTGDTGQLKNWSINVYGKTADVNNRYVYTNEFASIGTGSRALLTDTNGGSRDEINAAAVTSNSTINLNAGATSTIAGHTLAIANGSSIKRAYGGDGNDTLIGNAAANVLIGARGNDALDGGADLDLLDGGLGNDTLTGGTGRDLFVIRANPGTLDTITDFLPEEAGEKLLLVGFAGLEDFSQVSRSQQGADVLISLAGGQGILLKNLTLARLTEQGVVVLATEADYETYTAYASNIFATPSTPGAFYQLPTNQGDISFAGTAADEEVRADTANDLLDGGNGNDTLYGEYATPYLNAGRDWLEGGSGNDVLVGGGDADLLVGGSGNDYLVGEEGADFLDGSTGDDSLDGGSENDTLRGGGGRDVLWGGAGNDSLIVDGDLGLVNLTSNTLVYGMLGEAGADIFVVQPTSGGSAGTSLSISTQTTVSASNLIGDFNPGEDRIDLTAIASVRNFSELSITQVFTYGSAKITQVRVGSSTGAPVLSLYGIAPAALTASNFIFAQDPVGMLTGSAGNDSLLGGAGGDYIDGGTGADKMEGRTGDDTYVIDNAVDQVIELPDGGVDNVISSVSYTAVENVENLALTGNSTINATGNAAANRISGNAAANRLDGGAGADELLGGAGDDVYIVDNGNDRIIEKAGEGNDRVESAVSYTLSPDLEHLTLTGVSSANATGNASANTLRGNAADNTLDGAAGADTLIGGQGNDTYIVDQIGDVVIENLNEGIDSVISSVSYTLTANLENASLGGSANLALMGNALDNQLVGNSGANNLSSGNGNDILDGGAGADTLIGSLGDDVYVLDNVGDIVTENLNEGTDTVETGITHTLGANLENLILTGTAAINGIGNTLNNVLIGNSANNTLAGGAGADTMTGQAGNDTYVVDNVGDVVTENAGDGIDTVISSISYTLGDKPNIENLTYTGVANLNATGNYANNILQGNDGVNVLDGGAGNDTLRGGTGNDTYQFSWGYDQDVIEENDTTVGNTDVLSILSPADVLRISIDGSGALVVALDGRSDEIKVINWQAGNAYRIEQIKFADGNMLDATLIAQTLANGANSQGGAGNDTLTGTAAAEMLSGFSGDDNLYGLGGNDLLYGGAGSDLLDGGAGDDSMTGGSGSDTLQGGTGNDLYAVGPIGSTVYGPYGLTSFTDVIIENDATVGNVDVLQLGGPASAFLYVTRQGYDLGLSQYEYGAEPWYDISYEAVRISDYFLSSAHEVEQIRYSDGFQVSTLSLLAAGYYSLGTTANDVVEGGGGNDYLDGGVGGWLDQGAGDDTLRGYAGNDNLDGGEGNDFLDGGAGTDYLRGGNGDDVYRVVAGNGSDVVEEGYDATGNDILELVGVTPGAVNVTQNGNSMRVAYNGGAEWVTLESWFVNTSSRIEQIKFFNADLSLNSAWTTDDLDAHLSVLSAGTAGADRIYGSSRADSISGLGGNDTIYGQAGDDSLDGGADADTLYGGEGNDNLNGGADNDYLWGDNGNDTLGGGAGNDNLFGGAGNDTYILGRGYAADTVFENDATAGNIDIAQFLSGVAADQIWFQHVGFDLEASIIGTSDKLVVKAWYLGTAYHVEQFKTTDGAKTLLDSNVQNLVNAMASFAPPAAGQTTLPTTYQSSLAPVIAANWQ